MSVPTDHGVPADGLVAVVKRGCPTCVLVVPVLAELAAAGTVVVSQDDAAFPDGIDGIVDDTDLDASLDLGIEVVPTLLRRAGGVETGRVEGWDRARWSELAGTGPLGDGRSDVPDQKPGCGSRTADPEVADELLVRREGHRLAARRVEVGVLEDEAEALADRGWTDGLPVVAPTPARVLRMLAGTTRAPDDVVALVPPTLAPATVEKVAVNAVLAGCRPAYLPVVLAAVEAACTDEFNAHGLLATTYPAAPAVVVHGPIATTIGVNSGVNALGQGTRANSTIGRALQLTIRNVGGGRPGEVDRAALGQPGKVGLCFAEDEAGSPWTSLGAERGLDAGESGVTVFAAEGARTVVDQISRTPASLVRSLAQGLRAVAHPKLVLGFDATLVVCTEHAAVFRDAGWSRERFLAELDPLLRTDPAALRRGVDDIEEGVPAAALDRADGPLPKFRPGGLLVVVAGGGAGKFSAVLGGWAGGAGGSSPVTRAIGHVPTDDREVPA